MNARMKVARRVAAAVAVSAMMLFGGCKTGMFAPRTGELFQTTRMGPGPVAMVYTAPLGLGVWGAQTKGMEWTIPIGIVGIPIAAAGFVADECVVSPLVDLVCLPYDLCQPKRHFYFRIVDEFGHPVPNAKIWGHFRKSDYYWKDDERFSETTDAAGECSLNGSFDIEGHCWVSAQDYASWWNGKDFTTADAKPEPDGRIVLQFVLPKMNPGGWKAKNGMSRDEVLKLLPGKWSADTESRRWLQDGFNCPFANDSDRHCFTLDASGSAVSRVPGEYVYYFGRNDEWYGGPRDSLWCLEDKADAQGKKKTHRDDYAPTEWFWRVRLSEDPEKAKEKMFLWLDNYYLGEDEKGLYLSPGPFSGFDSLSEKLSVKYRKVNE